MKLEAGKEYRSRRGERVLVTAVDDFGRWPVHFVVMDGRYKGVGQRDGCRLMRDGRSMEPKDRLLTDHLNDLVEEWSESDSRLTRNLMKPRAMTTARD